MITVAGFNTAIDRLVSIDTLVPGEVRRAGQVQAYPGGKGLHVAQTIAALGEPVQLVGLTDAIHRNLIARRLSERGVLFHGVEIADELRSCIAVRERSGRVTEMLDPGPLVAAPARRHLLELLGRCADGSEAMVLSGSLPRGFADDTYAQLVRGIDQSALPCLVDASGAALRHAAEAGAFLLKPNRDEAAELAGHPVETVEDAVAVVRTLSARGIARPLVTLGALGAVGFDGDALWHASIAIDDSVNAVGSGDCFLAGVAVGLKRGDGLGEALRLGVACGAANAMQLETGYVRRADVDALRGQARLARLDG
ncbi:1-phosphofructokinase [Frateuria sp. Soil773]|uniref:1-phosphofructokinase family hexose kinase n=1 Tax=Frateuria sp. Soil773 TaxID=1736407 RepID=UPI0006F61937|nr:1-phosphofructokinase family hexose kinase [Frateuria sp. Soil773]KRE97848.1 1-phosphofructokinase [Frateuria sp. Soil773]